MSWNKSKQEAQLSELEREQIRKALYDMFVENRVSVVDIYDGELKAFQIWFYVLRKAGIKKL